MRYSRANGNAAAVETSELLTIKSHEALERSGRGSTGGGGESWMEGEKEGKWGATDAASVWSFLFFSVIAFPITGTVICCLKRQKKGRVVGVGGWPGFA